MGTRHRDCKLFLSQDAAITLRVPSCDWAQRRGRTEEEIGAVLKETECCYRHQNIPTPRARTVNYLSGPLPRGSAHHLSPSCPSCVQRVFLSLPLLDASSSEKVFPT